MDELKPSLVILLAVSLCGLLFLSGCAGGSPEDRRAAQLAHARDLARIQMEYGTPDKTILPDMKPAGGAPAEVATSAGRFVALSLPHAVERAMQANLDARVAALETLVAADDLTLEKLTAMPVFNASWSHTGRSNAGASSSRSYITGQQSLEPSVSTDLHRSVADMNMRWNVLDIAMTVLRSRSVGDDAKIRAEQYRKVLQTVRRDVELAYWRVLALQKTQDETRAVLNDVQAQLVNIDKARTQGLLSPEQAGRQHLDIANAVQSLRTTTDDLKLARAELKSLLSLPQSVQLVLTADVGSAPDFDLPSVQGRVDISHLERQALIRRPEMHESFYNRQKAARDVTMEYMKSLPGAELFLGYTHDSNSFLVQSDWGQFTLSIAQNLAALFTLPARLRIAENREELVAERQKAMGASVIAQVHMALHRYRYLSERYAEARSMADHSHALVYGASKRKEEGFISGQNLLRTRLQAQNAKVQAMLAYAEMRDAAGALAVSLGHDSPYVPEIQALHVIPGGRS